MVDNDGGAEANTDPAAAARDRERRRKMFALTKAAFPDLKVPTPFASVMPNE